MTEVMQKNDDVMIATNNVDQDSTPNNESPGSPPPPLAAANVSSKPPMDEPNRKKKKRGGFGIFKAALFMLRQRPQKHEKDPKKPLAKQNSAPSNATWKKLVGSMRPLHLPEAPQSPPPSTVAETSPSPLEQEQEPQPQQQPLEEMYQSPSSAASSSGGTMSQYASATSLHSMVDSSDDDEEEEEDPDEVFDALCGDEMIDAKAEEFIAQFYRQIHIQNTVSSHHHHRVHTG